MTLSEATILTIAGVMSACALTTLRFILKSRCSNISICCGAISCERIVIPIPATDVIISEN